MSRRSNIDFLCQVLPIDKARVIVAKRRDIQRKVVRTKTVPRIWPVVGGAAELIAGILAVLYLVAALALGGALLFYTFCH
jgi:hypothetical protein